MQVYNPDGTVVGTVQDVELPVGGGEISLQVLSKFNTVERIPWTMVGAAGDIVILREKVELRQPEQTAAQAYTAPAAATAPQPKGGVYTQPQKGRKEKYACPTCGKELTWIEQYQRWYCYNCGKYP